MAISTQEREISGFRECGSGLHIWPPELLFQKFIQGIVGRCFSSNHALKYGLGSTFQELLEMLL
jgi:hypothetical protein